MPFIRNVTFMTRDPSRLADFWSAALGLPERKDEATETICADAEWTYPRLTFQKVARMHRIHPGSTSTSRPTIVRLRYDVSARLAHARSAVSPSKTTGHGP
jgi:catechol 2,3-dioxygenase-like lactoylglutathione lyase family enzyme